jgi:DNA-binding response OmpR family regulator
VISILLALKDAKQRAQLAPVLRIEGFTTIVVGTHESPRRALETSKVDIVLLDRSNYGKNLLRDIRDRLDLRIVAIVKTSQERLQALASGADCAGTVGDGLIAPRAGTAHRT